MIWIVMLNSYGPGWEVPVEIMLLITLLSFLLLLCLVFSAVTFVISLKQYKLSTLLLKVLYSVFGLICIAFALFLLCVEGYTGQFWFEVFPTIPFLILSCGIDVLFFILILAVRKSTNNVGKV
jgi:hypothetical protein